TLNAEPPDLEPAPTNGEPQDGDAMAEMPTMTPARPHYVASEATHRDGQPQPPPKAAPPPPVQGISPVGDDGRTLQLAHDRLIEALDLRRLDLDALGSDELWEKSEAALRQIVAPGGCAASRREPGQRDHSPSRAEGTLPHHPQVQARAADDGAPDRVRNADAADRAVPRHLRESAAQPGDLRRHRVGEDYSIEYLVGVHPRAGTDRHHRGRRRAAARAGALDPARVAAAEHRRQGADHHPGPGAQCAADAARP